MPHVGNSSTEDLASSDEIKVFKDEGDDEKRASADLTDLKSSLITEGVQEKSRNSFSTAKSSTGSQQSSSHHQNGQRPESASNFGKAFETSLGYSPFSYPLPHSPYHPNGTFGQMANKMAAAAAAASAAAGTSLPPYMMPPNMERGFPQPPPAHMGIPPVHIETKAVSISTWMDLDLPGFARNPLYNLPGAGQYSHSVISDLTQQFPWPNSMYQLQSAAFRGPYSPLPSSSTFPAFGRGPLMPHPSLSGHSFAHPSFLSSAAASSASSSSSSGSGTTTTTTVSNGHKSKFSPSTNGRGLQTNGTNSPSSASSIHRLLGNTNSANNNNNNDSSVSNKNRNSSSSSGGSKPKTSSSSNSSSHSNGQTNGGEQHHQNKSHIKKPLNAFMIYMKEMRAKVIAESTLKESAAINQILGKRWHSLSRAEQEKYYDKARKERELHMELHPGWTAKDNYAVNGKRKKKKRERNLDGERGALKKCRARYGLDQQNHWCKPCRRKKKCIRYLEAVRAAAAAAAANGGNRTDNDDNLGSVGSVDVPTPESKSANESDHDNLNLSSTDLSLSSPPTSEYHHFLNSFNHHFQNAPAINSPNNPTTALHLNGHSNGHLTSSSLFYPHSSQNSCSTMSSPIGSRMSSLLTPNSPLTSSFSPASLVTAAVAAAAAAASSSSQLNQSQAPPRNSPFSIEQLARPHCPNRASPLTSPSQISSTNSLLTSGGSKNGSNTIGGDGSNNSGITVSVITQMPTPPSSTDSTSGTPAMLSVA